jgi:hypothetical protein
MIRGIGIGWRDGDWGLEWNGTGRDGWDVRRVGASVGWFGQSEYSRCVGWIEMDVMNHGRMGQMSRDGWGTDG